MSGAPVRIEEAFRRDHAEPGSFLRAAKPREFDYDVVSTFSDEREDPERPWTQGESPDCKGGVRLPALPARRREPDLEGVIEEMHNEVN